MGTHASLTNHYDRKYASDAGAQALKLVYPTRYPTDRLTACVTHLPPQVKGGRVLEIASGNGTLAASLIEAGLAYEEFTATELSAPRIESLRQYLAYPNVRVKQLNIEDMPDIPSATYDVIIMVALIEHLIDPLGAMQRIARMLRPGGIAYIDTPNIAKYTRRAKLVAGRFPSTASRNEGLTTYEGTPVDLHDEGHLHYFTYRSLTRMLCDRCGFESIVLLPYTMGRIAFGRPIDACLCRWWPSLFSEIALVARTPAV